MKTLLSKAMLTGLALLLTIPMAYAKEETYYGYCRMLASTTNADALTGTAFYSEVQAVKTNIVRSTSFKAGMLGSFVEHIDANYDIDWLKSTPKDCYITYDSYQKAEDARNSDIASMRRDQYINGYVVKNRIVRTLWRYRGN